MEVFFVICGGGFGFDPGEILGGLKPNCEMLIMISITKQIPIKSKAKSAIEKKPILV